MLSRNNIRLTLEGARAILAAAEAKAREIKVPQNIAIVDEGGHLLVFARMDGAKLSSIEVALTKARAAALRRSPTGPSPSVRRTQRRSFAGAARWRRAESSPAFEAACRFWWKANASGESG